MTRVFKNRNFIKILSILIIFSFSFFNYTIEYLNKYLAINNLNEKKFFLDEYSYNLSLMKSELINEFTQNNPKINMGDDLDFVLKGSRIVGRFSGTNGKQVAIGYKTLYLKELPLTIQCGIDQATFDAELEKIIKEHQLGGSICLHGPTKNINSEYANSQIFCIPSLFEGFGLVTVEAMSLGLPCVGFASCPGTNRIIDDDHGRLVDCDDLNKVEALAEQLKILILDSSLRDQLSAKAIKNAEDYFVENRISDWLKIIKNVTHE